MKIKYIYTLTVLSILFLASCGNDFIVEDNYDLTSIGGYVAFDAPGNTVSNEDVIVNEDAGGSQSLKVECPTGTLSDITVNYEFSGTAVFGEDFTVENADANGGTIVISPNASDVLNRDNADIVVEILSDDVIDGEKTVTVTLVSAANKDGDLLVGRGGTDMLKSRDVIIEDCDADISGMYTATATYSSHAFLDTYPTNTMDMEVTKESFGVFSVTDISGGLYSSGPYSTEFSTTGFPFTFAVNCNEISWEAQMDPLGNNVASHAGLTNNVSADGTITMTINLDGAEMEKWTIVMTPK